MGLDAVVADPNLPDSNGCHEAVVEEFAAVESAGDLIFADSDGDSFCVEEIKKRSKN